MMYGYDWGFGWLGMIVMLAFWVLIIVGVVLLIRWLVVQGGQTAPPPPPQETALDVLKKRYARGEIGKEEFEEKKKDLS